MTCPTTLTCSEYADGALSAAEAEAFQTHLADCASCRATVTAYVEESGAIGTALRAAEHTDVIPALAIHPSPRALLAWTAAIAAAAWLINLAWTTLGAALPAWLGWLAPDATGVGIEVFVSLALHLATGGAGMFADAVRVLGGISVIAAAASGLWLLLRRRPETPSLCISFALLAVLLFPAPPGHAFEVRGDDERVTVGADETINDTLVVTSEDILVEGTINGDLIALGETVTVRGRVTGMLLTAAEKVTVEGEVLGNVVSAAEYVDLRSAKAGANLYGAAREITLHPGTEIAGGAVLAAAQVEVHATVGRDLLAAAGQVGLFGNVGGDLRANAGELDVAASARIGGDLNAELDSEDDLSIAAGATIEGATNVEIREPEPSRFVTPEFYLWELLQLAAAFVFGLVLFWLFPTLRERRLRGGSESLTTVGLGAAALFGTPLAAVVVTITLIGAPLGIVLFLAWLMALYIALIVSAVVLGERVLGSERSPAIVLLGGLTMLFVLANIPVLGGFVLLAALLVGLGLMVEWLRGARATTATAAA